MVPEVDSSLLTQNPQFAFFSPPQWYGNSSPFHSCSSNCCCSSCCYSHCCCCFCCCHYFCFCSCLYCSLFTVLCYNTYQFVFNQSPVPFSVGSSATRIPFNGEIVLHTARKNMHEMMALHVSGMDIEAEQCNGEAVLLVNLNAHEMSSSKQSV